MRVNVTCVVYVWYRMCNRAQYGVGRMVGVGASCVSAPKNIHTLVAVYARVCEFVSNCTHEQFTAD